MDLIWIVINAVVVYLAFKLGQLSILSVLRRDLRDRILAGESNETILKDVIDPELQEDPKETVIELEQHQGQFYAFATTGEFLAQGPDFDTLFESIKSRFPGRNFRTQPVPKGLTEDQARDMIRAIFKIFGDKHDNKAS